MAGGQTLDDARRLGRGSVPAFPAPHPGTPFAPRGTQPARGAASARADQRQRHARAPAARRARTDQAMNPEFLTLEEIDRAADYIRQTTPLQPRLGLILGSGLGALAERVEQATR